MATYHPAFLDCDGNVPCALTLLYDRMFKYVRALQNQIAVLEAHIQSLEAELQGKSEWEE